MLDAHVGAASDTEATEKLFRAMRASLFEFTRLKNLSRRILEIESQGRNDVQSLLEIHYISAVNRTLSTTKRIRKARTIRQTSSMENQLVASLWLLLANMERLRRQWTEVKLQYEKVCAARHVDPFVNDHIVDDLAIADLDDSFIRETLKHTAARRDNRTLSLVTIFGGLCVLTGALMTAILTWLLT